MQAKRTILFLAIFALVAISCSKAITVLVINRSDATISIKDHGKQISCEPGAMISFIPKLQDGYDISIQSGNGMFFYRLTNTPASYLDIKHNKRILFVFSKDNKLYLLKPADKPMDEEIELQPLGYPLIPK